MQAQDLFFLSFRLCEALKLEYYTRLFLELSFSRSGGVHDKLHINGWKGPTGFSVSSEIVDKTG